MEDLVHQSERLAMEVRSDFEMPRVQKNLSQLLEAGNQLWNKTVGSSSNRDASDVRASVLLGAKGYDFQKVSRNLDSLVFRGVKHYSSLITQPTQPIIRETDIQGFLKNERENAILQVIDEIKNASKEQVQSQYWHLLSKDWDQDKIALLNSFIGPNHELSELDMNSEIPISSTILKDKDLTIRDNLDGSKGKQNLTITSPTINDKTVRSPSNSRLAKSNLDYQEVIYARCIMNYVDAVVSLGYKPDLVENFIDYVQRDIAEQNINELWETVGSVISSCDPTKFGSKPVKTRQGLNFLVKLVRSSRQLLERNYLEHAHVTVHGNMNNIEFDTQSCYNLIKSFLSLKSPSWLSNISVLNSTFNDFVSDPNDGIVDGHPVWLFIWHCLRGGMVDAAIEVAQRSNNSFISKEFSEMLRCYNETEDRRLPLKAENQLRLDYKRHVSKSSDLYKKAVYCTLASCDLSFTDPNSRIEDFLWMRLCQVRFDHVPESDDSTSSQPTPVKTALTQPLSTTSKLTFSKLQHLLSEDLGETHFNAQESPISYFKILFLTGLFEQAIEFIFRFQRLKSHAVHVAIALNEVGLLILPESYMNAPVLSKNPDPVPGNYTFYCLNYVNILIRYTKKFSCHNNTEALYYYYLLRNCTTPEKDNLFVRCVSELVRETGDSDHLLGYVNDFGRIGGVIDRFHLDVDEIVSAVAEDCENSGQYEAAVKLYDSTSQFTKVLEILIKLLSQVLPGRKSDQSERNKLETLALKIANRYCEPEISAPRDIAGTFYLLLDLMAFFNHYHANQHCEALDIIQRLKLLPFNLNEVEIKAREFNKYPEEIRKNIADILLATMNMLYATNKDQPSPDIRQKAKALITFSGMIQYRMPSEAIARLIELEVLID